MGPYLQPYLQSFRERLLQDFGKAPTASPCIHPFSSRVCDQRVLGIGTVSPDHPGAAGNARLFAAHVGHSVCVPSTN
jgi:hypothetical protein